MFDWLKRLVGRSAPPAVVEITPNNLFTWPANASLAPLDTEIVIALPRDLVADDEPLDKVLTLPDNAEVGIPPTGDVFYLRLQPGMKATIARTCPVYLVTQDADDRTMRRIEMSLPRK